MDKVEKKNENPIVRMIPKLYKQAANEVVIPLAKGNVGADIVETHGPQSLEPGNWNLNFLSSASAQTA